MTQEEKFNLKKEKNDYTLIYLIILYFLGFINGYLL